MTWVRRTPPTDLAAHRCDPPTRTTVYRFPSASLDLNVKIGWHRETVPDGVHGDLWRCDECKNLWRIGYDCDDCETYPPSPGYHGRWVHPVGYAWRPATWWQRITHRRRSAASRSPAGRTSSDRAPASVNG